MVACHLLLGLKVSVAEPFRVDDPALNSVDYGQADPIRWEHEVLPDAIVKVPVISALKLGISRPLHWVIKHGSSASLHRFVLVKGPS